MDNKKELNSILFLDIETVPRWPDYASVPEPFRALWDHKCQFLRKNEDDTSESLYNRAGIYAEFGKIICICIGRFEGDAFLMRSFSGDDEALLLDEFCSYIDRRSQKYKILLAAHNGKEFDFPYIARRLHAHHRRLPSIFDTSALKPWEIPHIDTMEMWKFGDYKSYTSLVLMCAVLGISTPKGDMEGSQVAGVYWNEKDLKRIVKYCLGDTLTVARLYCHLKYHPPIADGDVALESIDN
jgi:DNA polymerase elongation subunit (family B)